MPLRSKKSLSETELTPATQEHNHMDIDNDAKENIICGEVDILGDAVDRGQADVDVAGNDAVVSGQVEVVVAGNDEADIGFKDLESSGAPNIYVGKRNFIHQLMDVALLMANVSQLKSLLSIDNGDKYYFVLLGFICGSIILQIVFTISMLIIWSIERKLEEHLTETPKEEHPLDRSRRILSERLDKLGNVLVLLIIVSNVFITGFGVEAHSDTDSTMTNEV